MGGRRHDASGLDERQEAILRSLIREHIVTGEPIGSRTVSRGTRLDLSPATIRNVMAELEERGLLSQPHTSAGRVPTSRAYRLYVDHLMHRPRVPPAQAQAIDQALLAARPDLTDLLGEVSRQLSRFSHQVGVVLAPELRRIVVEHLEFVRLDGRRVVAILVGRGGVVHNRILETDTDAPLEQPELDWIGRYLSEEFGGRTLPEMRALVLERMNEERTAYDRLMARGLDLGRRTLAADEEAAAAAEVYVDGTANLLSSPEFADPERVRSLVQAVERKQALVDLLARVLEAGGPQVVIGEDATPPGASDLAGCSLVASTYGAGAQVMGTLGIVGPTRMEYAEAIALVDYLARLLNRYFSRPDN
jgi:heat-inducible transcriptional repressor